MVIYKEQVKYHGIMIRSLEYARNYHISPELSNHNSWNTYSYSLLNTNLITTITWRNCFEMGLIVSLQPSKYTDIATISLMC